MSPFQADKGGQSDEAIAGREKGEEGRVKPSADDNAADTNSVFARHKPKKQARRTLLPSLFPLHWQAHGIHAIALPR